jgi:large conductance mechanosensitive channel protein
MFKGFKDFLFRGNVIDLSVAVVIGAAFTAVVTAFTEAFLKPLIQLLSPGGGELAGTVKVDDVVFDYASFINQAITFIITAAVVYFLIVAPMKAIQARRLRGEESGPAQPTDVELLVEIRDLLQAQVEGTSGPVSAGEARVESPVDELAARLAVPTEAGPATAPVLPSATRAPAQAAPRAPQAHPALDTVPARPQRPAPPRPPAPQQPRVDAAARPYADVSAGRPESSSRHSR